MAIPDLLWACPSCGEDRGISRDRREAACQSCGVRYDRVDGARIRARTPDGGEVVRTAAEWTGLLPDPASLLEPASDEDGEDRVTDEPREGSAEGSAALVRRARVGARFVTEHQVVRDGGEYLNRIEIYGDEGDGTLELTRESVSYHPDDQADQPASWHFDDLTAVQASSRTLQLKGRGRPLVSFSFRDDSSFLWERLLEAAVARYYRLEGRGEVVELQPRICVR